METERPLAPYFLGAHGENDALFERLLVTALHDHVAWRRSFHPEDLPPLDAGSLESPEAEAFRARLGMELSRLTESLKSSVPFPSPRYIGHMASDILMPALLAQLVTTLYNPNNVSAEAAPVTVAHEIEAVRSIADMLGYGEAAWGHLTGGGTIANFEGLWHARALRCFPLALARGLAGEPGLHARMFADIEHTDDWDLLDLPVDTALDLLHRWEGALVTMDAPRQDRLKRRIGESRVEHVGMAGFLPAGGRIQPPVVMVPATAHYSWKKALQVMGMGSAQLRLIPVDSRMRMDIDALDHELQASRARREPVIAVVAALGTTEYGTIDPLLRILELRQRHSFWVHVDAAWGGYITSLFRAEDGSTLPHEHVAGGFRYFPSKEVHDSFTSIAAADSVTVDPHKLGYIPFGTGAFLCRDGITRTLVAQRANYVFGGDDDLHIGRYTMEGSRPGASAAAVCVAHSVLPLHAGAFGTLPGQSIRATEYLFDRLHELGERLTDVARMVVPFEPDTNLICIAVNPAGNDELPAMNMFMDRLYAELSVEPGMSLESREFFGSSTTFDIGALAPGSWSRLSSELGLDPGRAGSGEVKLLRHTLMNPWLFAHDAAGNYLDRYCWYLERLVIRLVDGL